MKRYQGFWERKGEATFLDIREPKASPAQGERHCCYFGCGNWFVALQSSAILILHSLAEKGEKFNFFLPLWNKKKKDSFYTIMRLWGGKSHFSRRAACRRRENCENVMLSSKRKISLGIISLNISGGNRLLFTWQYIHICLFFVA